VNIKPTGGLVKVPVGIDSVAVTCNALSLEETAQLFCISQPILSLTSEDENEKQIEVPAPDEYSPIDDRLSVHKIIDELPPDDRALIKLRFYDELTQSKTAQILGISQVQVSRREKIILARMREKLIS
jgi:RNA polymerase sporulation-specific sigma factor